MKLASYLLIFFIYLFQSSYGSNLISQSCMEASKNDSNLSYNFCVAFLEEASSKLQPPPTNIEDLAAMSIQLSISNGTNVVSIVSNLLNDTSFDYYTKACIQNCFGLYLDSVSALGDALVAFQAKNLDTAGVKVSAALDCPVTCENRFKENENKKGDYGASPLTNENRVYVQLIVISQFH